MPPSEERGREPRLVAVNIAGSTLTIRTDASQEYVTRLEKYVNDKMEAVQPEGRHLSVRSALALAALSIADDYFTASEKQSALDRSVRDRLRKVLVRLDTALGPQEQVE